MIGFVIGIGLGLLTNAAQAILTWSWKQAQTRIIEQLQTSRRKGSMRISSKPGPKQRRGLIYLLSQEEPIKKAIAYHSPVLERCWIITSLKCADIANRLHAEYPTLIAEEDIILVKDAFDPLEVREKVLEIYQTLDASWSPDDVIADFLGMTAVSSVGMVLACLDKDRPLEYTMWKENAAGVKEPLDPIEIHIDWETIGALPMPVTAGE